MRLTAMVAAFSAVLIATAASAADRAAPQTTNAKKSGFDPNQIICKYLGVSGTRLPGERVCLTWAEWDARSQADQRSLQEGAMRAGRSGVGDSLADRAARATAP